MRAIDQTLVDDVWREIIAYPPARADAEASAFLEGQPAVGAFVQRVVGGQPPDVQRAAFGLAFLLFKVLERSLGRPFPSVTADRLDAAQGATAEWLEAQGVPAADALAAVEAGHPTLARYMLGVFYGDAVPAGGGSAYDEGVRTRLTLALRTLTTALDLGEIGRDA